MRKTLKDSGPAPVSWTPRLCHVLRAPSRAAATPHTVHDAYAPDSYYVRLRESYQARRDLLFSQVEAAGFVAWKPKGAYYILTDAAHFMKQHGCEDDTAFAMFLVKEIGVATVPGSSFYAHPDLGRTKIRFCFPKTDDILIEAGRRLQKLAR